VEVNEGGASSLVRFFLTANERKAARVDANWRLVVTDALGEPGWCELDSPTAASCAERSFKFASPTKRSPTASCPGDL
jgi:hypothetical protein